MTRFAIKSVTMDTQNGPIDALPLTRTLRRFGYAIEFHEDQGAQVCVVSLGTEEAWQGRGADANEALNAALRKLAPSRIAMDLIESECRQIPNESDTAELIRHRPTIPDGGPMMAAFGQSLLERSVHDASSNDELEAPSHQVAESGERISARVPVGAMVDVVRTAAGRDGFRAQDSFAESEPSQARRTESIPPSTYSEPTPEPRRPSFSYPPTTGNRISAPPGRPSNIPTPISTYPPAPVRTGIDHMPGYGPTTGRELHAILADLETVAARVDAGIPEAALMAPPLQKLHVLAWIARARALEQEASRARPVSDATGAIARRLTSLCKTWWPGSVRALQLDATPERAAREQGLPMATRWLEVAESAEAKLERLVSEPPGDDGWRDTPVMLPSPDEPSIEIANAIRIIEKLIAPLDASPANECAQNLETDDQLRLEDAAARLRWARHVAPDPERWGAAVGRLRWLVAHKRGGSRLSKMLDPNHVPRPSWADEARSARARLVALTRPPETPSELLTWLTAVFDAVDGPTLAQRLHAATTATGEPLVPLVMSIRDADLPKADRRTRRRLRQLQTLLYGGPLPTAASPSIEPATHDIDPIDEPCPVETPRLTHEEMIFSEVRTMLAEVPALFVSNREDPQLKERLVKMLGWDMEWTTAEPRRIASIAGAIGRGKYKVVLSATGFQDHATDIALARAASASSTLYVRVNRGRSAACARALARELGIRVDTGLDTDHAAALADES